MKRYKSILLVLFSILACQSEIDQNENTNGDAKTMSFYAGIEIPKDSILTKTVLDGSPSDAYRNVLWEYQDEVYVTNGTQSSKFINTSQGTSEIALLEGQLAEGANYFAAYPFNIVTNSSASSFSVDLPSEQTYCADGIDSEAFPMVAQCKEGVFNFKNICGILVVQLLGDETVSSITFSGKDLDGNSLPVSGTGTVSMSYLDVPTLVMNNSSDTSVSLSSSTGVKLNANTPTSFHIVLPSGTYDTFELAIVTKDGSKMLVHSSKPLTIKRSQRTTAAALTYVDIIDLSSTGTANCYIVSESGKYKFNASVKGNSSESIGEAVSAEVLWESFGTDVTPSVGDIVRNVAYKDGNIEFEAPSQLVEGNAVIAAKDASGTILWSWHIWVTDEPEEHVYPKNTGIMMDRNLGATSAIPGDFGSLGLLYQWGRKDPFLGSASESNSEAKSTITWLTVQPSSPNTGSIEYTINNPTTYIGYNPLNNDWLYTGSSNTDKDRWGDEKTKYDPCPSGWKVPNDDSINCLSSYYDKTYKGILFNISNHETTWYPSPSYRLASSGDIMGLGGAYWTVTPEGGIYANALKIESYSSSKYKAYIDYEYKSYGYSVRCIKE